MTLDFDLKVLSIDDKNNNKDFKDTEINCLPEGSLYLITEGNHELDKLSFCINDIQIKYGQILISFNYYDFKCMDLKVKSRDYSYLKHELF